MGAQYQGEKKVERGEGRPPLLQTSRPDRTLPNTSQRNEGQQRPWGVGTKTGVRRPWFLSSLWALGQVS